MDRFEKPQQALKAMRLAKGLTQKELAELLELGGTSAVQRVKGLESTRPLSLHMLREFGEKLGFEVSLVFEQKSTNTSKPPPQQGR